MLLGIHAFKLFLWKFAISIFKFSLEVRLCFHLIQIINRSTQKHFRYYFYPRIASCINVKVEWGSTSAIMTTLIYHSTIACIPTQSIFKYLAKILNHLSLTIFTIPFHSTSKNHKASKSNSSLPIQGWRCSSWWKNKER